MNGTQQEASKVDPESDHNTDASTGEAPDQIWDALNRTYVAMQNCNASPQLLLDVLRDKEVVSRVQDKKALTHHANVLSRDVSDYNERLSTIHRKHADRVGNSRDIDDQLEAIQIHEGYIEWSESYSAVVLPNIATLTEMLQKAGAQLDADRLLAGNPAVAMDEIMKTPQGTTP